MKETEASSRYARALFLAVRETKGASLEAARKGLEELYHKINADARLKVLLSNPRATLAEKRAAVKEKLKIREHLLDNFFDLLIAKKRTALLPMVLLHFQSFVEESQGVMKAYVKSAQALSESDKKAMEKRLSEIFGKKISIEVSVNPELLAGAIVKAGDTVIDGSMRSRLKNLKASFRGSR